MSRGHATLEYSKVSAVIQLVLIYLPFLIMAVYVVVLLCRNTCRQSSRNDAQWTTPIFLKSSFNKGNNFDHDEEELPHRLITDCAADYECFEDADQISYTKMYTESNIDATY